MSNTLTAKVVRSIVRGMGLYFGEGQITYELKVGGKFYAAENYLHNPMLYGVPRDECRALIDARVGVNYIVDFVFENASKVEQFNVVFREAGLEHSLTEIVKKASADLVIEKTDNYRITVSPVQTEEPEVVVEAPAPTPVPAVAGDVTYLHIGIPVTNKKEGMIYLESHKVWITNPDDYDFKIEYLKFEEGTDLPNILHRNPHVAYMVPDMKKYLDQADWVIYGPTALSETTDFAYIMMENTIFELQAKRK